MRFLTKTDSSYPTTFRVDDVKVTVVTPATSGSSTTPAAPTSLTATAVSSTQVNLSWSDRSNNERGFYIERKIGTSGSWVPIVTVVANNTTFQDKGRSPNTQYYYRVQSSNAAGNSAFSNTAGVTTPSSATVADRFRYPLGSGRTRPTITGTFGGSYGSSLGHLGEDYSAAYGTSVYAAANGVVEKVVRFGDPGYQKSWGQLIYVRHAVPGLSAPVYTMYAHLSSVTVNKNDTVSLGQRIGASGRGDQNPDGSANSNSYNPHLHFEIRAGGGAGSDAGAGYAHRNFTTQELIAGSVFTNSRTHYKPSRFIEDRLIL